MEISGEHRFRAPRPLVWAMLLDPVALRAAMPGCEQLAAHGPSSYAITLRVGIAEVKGTYSGTVEVRDLEEGESYRLVVSGSGKPGSVEGEALLTLSDDGPSSTLIRYRGDLQAQGAIARLGSTLLTGSARLLVGQFFKGMEKQVDARAL